MLRGWHALGWQGSPFHRQLPGNRHCARISWQPKKFLAKAECDETLFLKKNPSRKDIEHQLQANSSQAPEAPSRELWAFPSL